MQLCRCFIFTSWFGPLQWKPRTFDTTATTGYCSSDDKPGSSTGFYETRWFPYAPPKFNMEAENDGFQKKNSFSGSMLNFRGVAAKDQLSRSYPPFSERCLRTCRMRLLIRRPWRGPSLTALVPPRTMARVEVKGRVWPGEGELLCFSIYVSTHTYRQYIYI